MAHYNLAMLGFGNVGQALAKLLFEKSEDLWNRYRITYSITAIGTKSHGMAIDPDGIEIEQAIRLLNHDGDLSSLSANSVPKNAYDFIRQSEADVFFENTPVNYDTGEPAISHLLCALENDMHIITANKGPVVHAFSQLSGAAAKKGRKFYFESTVMDGAPIFSLFRETLPTARLNSFRGILNSTTNMILTRMEGNESFDQALSYCQEIGIAETDPSGDIDGWDAAVKVSALVNVLMGISLKPDSVNRKGIQEITREHIKTAQREGKRWKLVCLAERMAAGVSAKVSPELVGPDSPMYTVNGTTSIVIFDTDVIGKLSIVEQDPGPHTTAYGLFSDFIAAIRPQ